MAKNTLTTAFYQTEKGLKHPIPVRAYKDRIFRMIFKEKRALLALYNAMNDTAYQDPEELVITTLENAIYLGMKNDVSFMICDRLFLYEHQSTKNPNAASQSVVCGRSLLGADKRHVFVWRTSGSNSGASFCGILQRRTENGGTIRSSSV